MFAILASSEYRISSNILGPISGRQICARSLRVSPGRHEGQVFFCDPGIAGQEELIEDLIAGSPLLRCRHILDEAIVGKFLREYEGAGGDALPDFLRAASARA